MLTCDLLVLYEVEDEKFSVVKVAWTLAAVSAPCAGLKSTLSVIETLHFKGAAQNAWRDALLAPLGCS